MTTKNVIPSKYDYFICLKCKHVFKRKKSFFNSFKFVKICPKCKSFKVNKLIN